MSKSLWRSANAKTIEELPVGKRQNNRGAIEVASDAGRSLIERVTNAHDAVLELEHQRHSGTPKCRSPREAAAAWLGVPERDGLAGLSIPQRQKLAESAIVRLEPGEGSQSRVVTVIDRGCGIAADRMEETILSLNESNKIQKHYLAGTYGQGGSSTFAFSKYTLIASRVGGSSEIGFTVVRYLDLPAEEYKTGRYVYLVDAGKLLTTSAIEGDPLSGTVVRHFGFDLTNYSSSIGPKSLYGVLQRVLFDPVAPIWLENKVNGWKRVIKGARNALNGAADHGDESATGPELDHQVPMFNISLGDYGEIGIEYWVLKRPSLEKGKSAKNPADAFVDSRKPIILTHNGQNQGELSALLIKRDADLPFLRNRVICHINCDRLTPAAKRLLFASTREHSREGYILSRVDQELVSALKADDEMARLNALAREESLKEQDDSAEKQMRQQVAKLLRISGAALIEASGGKAKKPGEGPVKPRGPKAKPEPIFPSEPPTYIRIVWDDEIDVPFHGGLRRYIRIETDANSDYHDANEPAKSRINVAVGNDLKVFGTSPLRGGRMRIGIECKNDVVIGSKGSVRVEIYRPGQSALSDERGYVIVMPPQPKEDDRVSTFPDFKLVAVAGPEEQDWNFVCDDTDDDDISKHASGSVMNQGTLYIYYSTSFPRFTAERRKFEQQNPVLAQSFQKRYELWLAVHALLVHEQREETTSESDEVKDAQRQERCRTATLAVMVSNQEIKTGIKTEDAEIEAA